jgi:hypothetical protein
MKRQIFILVAVILMSLTAIRTHAQTKEATLTEADYTDWFFVQSDKALQYRFAVAKKEGTVHHLQLQFRVKSDDEVHCRGAECDGYVLYLSHATDGGGSETVKYHLYFEPSFSEEKSITFLSWFLLN